MNNTRAIAFTATSVAIALACMTISRFLPLRFTPLMVVGLCFFIAFCQGIGYGIICITTTMLLSFFMLGGLSGSYLFVAFIFAPYSLLAFLIKKLTYNTAKEAIIRITLVITLFNLTFLILALTFGRILLEQVILGYDVGELLIKFGSKPALYSVVVLASSAFMAGYDYIFVTLEKTLNKRIGFRNKNV